MDQASQQLRDQEIAQRTKVLIAGGTSPDEAAKVAEKEFSVIDKIKKLLAFTAEKTNQEEATAAAERVQELLMRYNIDMERVKNDSLKMGAIAADPLKAYHKRYYELPTGPQVTWRRDLFTVLAENNFCEMLWLPQYVILIGEPHNTEVVVYLYESITQQLEPLATEAHAESMTRVKANVWKPAFFLGATTAINERLSKKKARMQEDIEGSRALVVVKTEELKRAVTMFYPKIRRPKPKARRCEPDAYSEGVKAGKNVQMNPGLSGSSPSQKSNSSLKRLQ